MLKSVIICQLITLTFVLCFPNILLYNDPNDIDGLRIIEGSPASIKDHPYFAGLNMIIFSCGSSIISSRWLLTAAHCVDKIGIGVAYVGGDAIDNSDRVIFRKVILHPDYDRETSNADIALVYLSQPLNFTDKIQPIKLPETMSSPQRPYLIVGRGQNENGFTSKYLMKLGLKELSPEKCPHNPIYDDETFNQKFICTTRDDPEKPELPATVCYGDSGSGLTQDNTVVGIASFIYRESCITSYFTRVSTYVPWIKCVTGIE